MIAFLQGRLLEKQPSRLILDVHGVGYEVHVPFSTFFELAEPGADVVLRIHTYVREDQLVLFGFATRLELELFERLIGVSGVGPKVALAVLSGIEPSEFVLAVERADVARLTTIPGIGKKTAERLTLELRDRLPRVGADVQPAAQPSASPEGRGDLVSALSNLGYPRAVAEKAADAALRSEDGRASFEGALRAALRELGG